MNELVGGAFVGAVVAAVITYVAVVESVQKDCDQMGKTRISGHVYACQKEPASRD